MSDTGNVTTKAVTPGEGRKLESFRLAGPVCLVSVR